ncbi:MAG: dienelactone hydrolase family protein [Alphaproteobacteria bacterium]
MRSKPLCGLALCLALAMPSLGAAQTRQPGAPETLASFPLPPLPDRPLALQFLGAVALFSLPEAPARKNWPAVLILPDALGADGRAEPYIENLLGAGIVVLELRNASADAAQAAMAILANDPRIAAPRLGVLGFGQGGRLALGLPGAEARALLYPGCANLPAPPNSAGSVLLVHGAEDPTNSAEACARLCAALREAGAEATQREIPGAGYAWDLPALGRTPAALLPAAGSAERLAVRPWPAMAAQSAAEIAGFFADHFSRGAP